MLSFDCKACHGRVDAPPVLLDNSLGTGGFAISCVGCHGREEDQGPTSGRGAGLRQHHFNAGVTVCANCHPGDSNPVTFVTVGEDFLPLYYRTPVPDNAHPNKPTDSCNPNGEEDFAATTLGLDNDGDGVYDMLDSDCAPVVDSDDDGIPDDSDNCPTVQNGGQANSDADSIGDACDYCRNVDLAAGTQHQDDDGDGAGNECDIDFDQSGFGNTLDLIQFLDTFGKNTSDSTCPDASGNPIASCTIYDVTVEGPVINVNDLLVVIGPLFGQPISNHNCAADDTGTVQCPLP
jgi:hypothetical protein